MNKRPVAVITGASQGIGAATARAFAKAGYDLTIASIDPIGLNKIAGELKALGSQVLISQGDLADLDYAQSLFEDSRSHWGRIDVLVNNAAWRDIVTMRAISVESWNKTLQVCLTAPAFLSRWCAEIMEAQKHGVILNISSIQSRFVAGVSPAYVAAKGGIDALTYELSTLYGPSGIRVLALNLGAIDTELSKGYGSSEIDQKLRDTVEDMIPLRRYAQPDEIGNCIAMFANPAFSYLTGTTIEIDGGWFHQCSPYSLKHQQFPQQF